MLILQQPTVINPMTVEQAMSGWLRAIAPELVLAGSVVVLLPLGAFLPPKRRGVSTWLALVSLAWATLASIPLAFQAPHAVFSGTYVVDPYAVFFKFLAFAATALVLLATREHFRGRMHEASVPTVLMLTCLGLVTLAASQDLVLITLFLSLVTVGSYVLVGIAKEDRLATEGALKLFLFGSVATAVMAYGMVLLYGLTGTLSLPEIARKLPDAPAVTVAVALAFTVVGYAFKVTAVPFHFWAPDTYQGAPTPIAAFLSVGPKAAGLAVLLRMLAVAAPEGLGGWPSLVAALAAVTMTAGNLLALRQSNVKRLLAYSSVAQAGYLLMGVAAYGRDALALPGMLVYLAVYLLMNLAAFLAVAAIERAIGSAELEAFAGIARRLPLVTLAFALALLALAGIPPMGSFVGKVMLFGAAMGAGMSWLAVVAAANSALSLYYYARVLEVSYLRAPGATDELRVTDVRWTVGAVVAASLATLTLGVLPAPLVALATHASTMLHTVGGAGP